MATYVNNLRLKEIATGDESGTWGTSTNTNLELIGQALGFGTEGITTNADTHTSSVGDGAADEARAIYLKYTGTLDSACTITIGPNTMKRFQIIENATSGSQSIIISQGSGANITIKTGAVKAVYLDGAGSGAAVLDALVDLDLTGTTTAAAVTASGALTGGTVIAGSSAAGTTVSAGNISLKNGGTQSTVKFYCESNNAHYAQIQAPAHSAFSGNVTLTLPATTSNLVGDTVTQTMTNKTLTSPVLNTGVSGTAVLDSDTMSGASATKLASSESIKAYVDSQTSSVTASSTTTFTNKTLTAAKIVDGGFLADANGNELIKMQTTSSAVNELELTNAATGGAVVVGTSGGDSNIDLTLTPKGTGEVNVAAGNLNYAGTAVTATGAELNKLDGAGTLKQAGLETIYVPAAAMYPNTTNGCSNLTQVELSNGPELKCLDFADGADDFAQFTVSFPKSWNEGTVTFQAFWTVTGTNTGTVAWGLSGISFADNAVINTAFGTQVVATAKAFSGTSNDMTVSAVSGAVTISNAAVDTQTYFQVSRDVSADSQSGAARLLGIKLFFTTNAANDA